MQSNHFLKAGLLGIVLVVLAIGGWELYLRNQGLKVDYDDKEPLWAEKRSMVYVKPEKGTVFIGSSRIKYDLDIDTWRKLTGQDAIQLAVEGSSPLPVFDDLAADENFKGNLIVDVTEGLFFSTNRPNLSGPADRLGFFKKRTPSEKASFHLNRAVESNFVFLDQENFTLNAMMNQMQLRNRPGVFAFPIFPKEFGRVTYDRQNIMMDKFLQDTSLQNQVTGIWMFFRSISKEPPASGNKLDSFFKVVKANCDKIKARGGNVLFVRTPSSGPYWMGEQMGFPREKYWDALLKYTDCPGIHFNDYKSLDHFKCPEWSHLSPQDAIVFTKEFVRILRDEKGWMFSNQNLAFKN